MQSEYKERQEDAKGHLQISVVIKGWIGGIKSISPGHAPPDAFSIA